MKSRLGAVFAAVALAAVFASLEDDAGATYAMVPAAAGVPYQSGESFTVTGGGAVYANGASGVGWYIPAPNVTGSPNSYGYIDLGKCVFGAGQGYAMDDYGNIEAMTNTVYASNTTATSQIVTFGSGFTKSYYTYIAYFATVSTGCQINGIEYIQ